MIKHCNGKHFWSVIQEGFVSKVLTALQGNKFHP